MFTQETFNQFMDGFFNSKFNQLSYSNQRYPKRMEKLVLDLSVAPTQPVKVPVPFKSCLVSRIYSTSVTTTDKAGTVKIMFDYDNLMNQTNAVNLFVNDSFVMDTAVAQAYLTWSAQSDTTIEIYFFVDIDYRAGTTKTQIVGTVTVQEAAPVAIKQVPSLSIQKTAVNTTATYTVPAGKYAVACVNCMAGSTGIANATVNGVVVMGNVVNGIQSATGTMYLRAGDVLVCSSSSAQNIVSAQIAEYTA